MWDDPTRRIQNPMAKKIARTTEPRINVVLSDLHCGSDVGLLPPRVQFADGHIIGCGDNPLQGWMWDCFQNAQQRVAEIVGGDPFILTLGGDLIEGAHHRSDEVVAIKLVEHLHIAKQCMEPLVRLASKTIVIRGTECHTHDWESLFARDLGISDRARDFEQYTIGGCLVDARHHMPVTSRLHLESGGMGIVMANNRSNAVRCGHTPARIFLRGHRHVPGSYSDGESMLVVTGGWQGLTRYGKKVVADSVSRPSVAILDWRNCDDGQLPALHHLVYNPPQHLALA